MQLYNKLSSKERATLIDQSNKERITLSFYQYAKILDPKPFRDQLFIKWDSLDVLGRIYVANEGVNAQLSIPKENFREFERHLRSISFFKNTTLNIAVEHDNKSFLKLKIKVRNKIVADGLNDKTFDVTNTGIHLDAVEFNKIAEKEDSIIVDMRNHYESEIGHFKNAIKPDVNTFRESLDLIENDLKNHKEDKNLIMYCTGGIRCEKASAYFKHKGFKNVFQLKGGIIEYAKQVSDKKLKNNFIGKNFVFDERRAEKISEDIISVLFGRGKFDSNDVSVTSSLLAIYAFSLPAYMISRMLNQIFYSFQKVHLPIIASIPTFIINLSICFFAYEEYGVRGLAFSSVISVWFNVIFQLLILKYKIHQPFL